MIFEKFFFVFLIFWGLRVICDKYSVIQRLEKTSIKYGIKLLYNITQCNFCFEHHLSFIPTLLSFLFFPPQWGDLFLPFMVASLSNIILRFQQY